MAVSNTRKRVRFTKKVVAYEAPEEAGEKEDVWYSPQELFNQKKEIFVAVQYKDTEKADPNYNWRGLEHYQTGTPTFHLEKRQDFVCEFLSLQHDLLQREIMEQDDPLSLFAANKSKHNRKEANKRAKQDEAEANKIYKSSNLIHWRQNSNEKDTISAKMAFMMSMVKGFRPGNVSKFAQTA
ncbi:expressed unknown protein [Seminavis robusta]|uniref:Uncharacterized protein n=1 Tax=Seminavis robusta TaxID=568900 RepID=A0A9N8EK29_9STRA|nr:expressed unknown protein [Seminavis robusta]|eukprot:Sro1275_g258500.1 n/a (182) ;mRNA; f:24231-24776